MELVKLAGLGDTEAEQLMVAWQDSNGATAHWELSLQQRTEIWAGLASVLSRDPASLQLACLHCCRLLSRDKTGLDDAVSSHMVETLQRLANIQPGSAAPAAIELESLKVLSNLLHQSGVVRAACANTGFLSHILSKVKNYHSASNQDTQYFDLRLVFLFTYLCPEQKEIAKYNLQAVEIFRATLETTLQTKLAGQSALTAGECNVIGEVLKVLFNLTVDPKPEDGAELEQVAATLNRLLRLPTATRELQTKLVSNTINVATNLESQQSALQCLVQRAALSPPASQDREQAGIVTNSLDLFLDLLEQKTGAGAGQGAGSLKEEITPCLSLLWHTAHALPAARKYLRSVILPPLTAAVVKEKPEAGDSLKGRLVSLLTNAAGDAVPTMVAELLFVLCKENVGRLVKHTGYGNAAGLLARRGLMAGGRPAGAEYSSEEESEEEEEVRELRDQINPVLGCTEQQRPSPLDGMTEEQKEFEAVQLMNLMDKMQRSGLIQPARVGEDGRPEPVEHVLQLAEGQAGGSGDQEDSSDGE